MLRFSADEWFAAKKQDFQIDRPVFCKVQVSCTSPVEISIDGIPVKSGNEFTYKFQLDEGLVVIRSKETFGAKVEFTDAQSGEPFDTKEVVALAVAGNMLQQIRQRAAREEHEMRTALLDHRNFSYEIDEDDERFEEEMMAMGSKTDGEAPEFALEDPEPSSGGNPPEETSDP